MKKLILIYFVVIICITVTGSTALGSDAAPSPGSLLNLYTVEDSFAVGLQQHLFGGFYGAADIEYWSSLQDLRFHAGTVYYIPREVLFFRIYGGAGYQFSRDNTSNNYPYFLVGTRFLFIFGEVLYPWAKQAEPQYRLGFSLDFSKKSSKSPVNSYEIIDYKSVQADYDLFPNIKLIEIDNQFGEVEVKYGAAGVVSMTAEIELRTFNKKELDLYRDDINVTGAPQGDYFKIAPQLPKLKSNVPLPKVAIKMVIYVPADITVEVNGNRIESGLTEL